MKTLLVVALVACGGSHRPEPRGIAHATPRPSDGAAPAPEPSPTGAECDQLLDHAIALATPADKPLTDAELAQARAKLHDEFTRQCLAMPRAIYACALAAPTMQELAACDQAAPSSSTSNSSVAPGGITPAAPLAP